MIQEIWIEGGVFGIKGTLQACGLVGLFSSVSL